MKKLLLTLSTLLAMMSFVACEKPMDEPPFNDDPAGDTPTDTIPAPSDTIEENLPEPLFTINVHEDLLAAYSVTFDIVPADKDRLYYYEIISKARISEIDVTTLKAEIIEGVEKLAQFTGSSYEEVLASTLKSGDQLNVLSNAGYRPDCDFYIYAFYWDATSNDELCLCEFTTPSKQESTESIEVNATVDVYSMTIDVLPSSGVAEYWYYFAERSKAEAMLADLEDENAFLSYQAMNVGTRKEVAEEIEHKGLKPATEYMVLIMAIDDKLNRFAVQEVFTTEEEKTQELVESQLFELLLGEWEGTQTITDNYAAPAENKFTVNIMSSVEGVEYDYRAMNQLVATVDGWCNVAYYGVEELRAQEIEDPELKWGPKWVFNIADGDVVTMDGKACNAVMGWFFFGDCFMLNGKSSEAMVYTTHDFNVEVSDDYNTITIKSPASMQGAYPSLGYYFDGLGWMGYYYGCSDIVLTRK